MGIDKYTKGGYEINPNPNIKSEGNSSFSEKYNLPELLQEVYFSLYNTGESTKLEIEPTIPIETEKKLTKHLLEEFSNTKGDTEVIKEMIKDEALKYFKMMSI